MRVTRNLKKSEPSKQKPTLIEEEGSTQDEPRDPRVKLGRESNSQNGKPTCAICGKRHYGKCLIGIGN